MDNYDLKVLLHNLDNSSKRRIKELIEDGSISLDNIVDILFAWERKLRKIEQLAYLFYDLDFAPNDKDWEV